MLVLLLMMSITNFYFFFSLFINWLLWRHDSISSSNYSLILYCLSISSSSSSPSSLTLVLSFFAHIIILFFLLILLYYNYFFLLPFFPIFSKNMKQGIDDGKIFITVSLRSTKDALIESAPVCHLSTWLSSTRYVKALGTPFSC